MSTLCVAWKDAARLALLLLSSCVGSPPAPQAPAAQTKPAAALTSPPPPDLSQVPDPPALVLSGRLAKPSASLSIVRAWTKLPVPQAEEVTELVMGETAGSLVDLEQPIDFAIAVTGVGPRMRDRMAVSVALKSVDTAKAALAEHYKLVPGENGVLLLHALDGSGHEDEGEVDRAEGDHRACEIAPAYGAAAVRLVCGWSGQALSELAPWLTRTMTRVTTTSDLHVDVRLQPLRPTLSVGRRFIASLLATGIVGRLSSVRDLAASVGGDVVDFALDLDTASVDVLVTEPAVSATAALRFSGRASAFSRLAAAHPERSAAAPQAFWQLPADADSALFERGIDEAELARVRDLVLRMVGDALGEYGIKDTDRKPIVDALGKLTSTAPLAYASGLDSDAARKAIAAEVALHDGSDAAALAEARRASAEALFGWRVIEVDEASARLSGALKDLASAWGRPGVAQAYRARAKGAAPPALHTASMPKGVALPTGSEHYVIELGVDAPSPAPVAPGAKPRAAVANKPVAIHLYLVPDGARTWVGLGGGDTLVASKLAVAIGQAGDKLAGRADLATLKAGTFGSGGFVTARGLAAAGQALAGIVEGSTKDAAEALDEVDRLPHRGAVPLTFSLTARPDLTPAPVVASLDVPRAAIEDIVTVILRHGF